VTIVRLRSTSRSRSTDVRPEGRYLAPSSVRIGDRPIEAVLAGLLLAADIQGELSRNSLGALTLGKRPLNRRPFLPQRLPIIFNHRQHIALYGVVAERDKPVVTGPTGTAA
jgi:hypothetical protein